MTKISKLLLALGAALLLAGCGEGDPGALGPSGVDGGLSPEGKRQEYADGVSRALDVMDSATDNQAFSRAVATGNARQLQTGALAWQQGVEQLKGLNPPKDAVEGHKALIAAAEGMSVWNQRLVKAAPNKARTKKVAMQIQRSPEIEQYARAICMLVDAGYEIVGDPGACTPFAEAEGPVS